MIELKPFQQRVVEEHRELSDRLAKLIVFVDTEVFDSLPGAEKVRLVIQRSIMQAYADLLADRIANFETAVNG